jgi:flagella basal body P-ring formation protein FlgA
MRPVPPVLPIAYAAALLACAALSPCVVPLGVVLLDGMASPAEAATLRTMTTLHGPRVKLSDLFDDAGTNADHVLGPGPAPGGRIVVESAQLAAIAHQFDVDWHPASSADRAVLDWPGKELSREAALGALREAVAASGVRPENCDISLASFSPPLVPFDAVPHPLVSQLDFDRVSGRFSAVLSVTGEGIDTINTRITGQVDELIELPVATARLPAGTVLRAEDVHMARVHVALANRDVARELPDAIGLQLRHQVSPGQPFALADLAHPEVVRRGANVLMLLDSPGILLTAQGQAMDSGAIGERIRVMNPVSRAVIEAEVIGTDRVRVSPGGLPLMAAAADRSNGQVMVQ